MGKLALRSIAGGKILGRFISSMDVHFARRHSDATAHCAVISKLRLRASIRKGEFVGAL